MQTRAGPLLSVPYPMELNDAGSQVHRTFTPAPSSPTIVDQFQAAGWSSVNRWCLRWRYGFIVGQFRLRPLRQTITLRRTQAQRSGLVHARRRYRQILFLAPERRHSGQLNPRATLLRL
jgi:hypothetical protein